MERTIKVTGNGKLSVKPDTIRLIMTISGFNKDYDSAVKDSTEKTEEMKNLFESLGFNRDKLKTLYFNIGARYENYQTINKTFKSRFKGYEYTHKTKIEFLADNKLLGSALFALSKLSTNPDFDIEYTVADMEKAKNRLLGNAIKDSMEKANVLTQSAGVKLAEILKIDYSWDEIEFVSRPFNENLYECSMALPTASSNPNSYNIDIDPEDIKVSDTVTIIWRIE